ncbi:hypothetical protein QOZ80_2BG0191020 [Eleusine coracana subsp. coracana]|nr:hypothetical protein QOZ80_2BG0191020 [Eleusine coracana subsp. coracana]
MVEDTSPSQDTVEINGNVVHKIVSYDKDVVEIKLADTIDSDKYGGNFVKDVGIDEGTFFHPKILEEKLIDRRPSPKVSCQMNEANSNLIYRKKGDVRKSVNELKPEAILPVDLVPSKNEELYSTGKEYDDHDGGITTDYIADDPSDKKISLQELLLLESAEESQLASTINCEGTEKQHPHEAVGQAPINGSHEIQAVVPKPGHVSSGVSSTMSEDQGATLDMKKPNQIDRHNPFIDHRSLVVEDISEPACSAPAITDDSSTEPICTVSKTGSFSNAVSGSTELIEVGTAESGLDAARSSNPDIRLSEKSNDAIENLASKAITEAVDEAAVATSSPRNISEHSDLNGEIQEKCDVDGVSDIHDCNQIDEEDGIDKDNAVSNTLDSALVQTVPESSRSTTRTSNGDPYESNFFGPSIMSAPVSNSGHIAYSGNISLRSDSSTTSTRSFAFPVLQREWISSPVRMAKAERRRHLGWRKGLICCKF